MTKELLQTDILIIGSGIAGSTAAIKLAEKNPTQKIVLLTKTKDINESNTHYAQGGIIAKGGADLVKDILSSGDGLTKKETAQILADEGPKLVEEFLNNYCQTPFDKTKDNKLSFALEGGHSEPRVAKVADYTGKSIEENLTKKLASFKNIEVEVANEYDVL